jgi:predicted metal-dependent hydrolase
MKSIIYFENTPLIWVKTRRKNSFAVKASLEGIRLLTPSSWSVRRVERVLQSHHAWFQETLSRQAVLLPNPLKLERGVKLSILGYEGQLEVIFDGQGEGIEFSEGRFVVPIAKPKKASLPSSSEWEAWVKKRTEAALKSYFKRWVNQRVVHWSERMQLYPSAVTVKSYKARWGSCDVRGGVQFNWKLVFAPAWVADYVVVHELAHLKHRHHGQTFWAFVKQYSDKVEASRAYLRREGLNILAVG